jgi:hypothetical protein
MTLDHITFQVDDNNVDDSDISEFMHLIDLIEVSPSADIMEKGWNVRWFQDDKGFQVHLVGGPETPQPSLSHFCVKLPIATYGRCRRSSWLEHDSGSGRIWLKGPQNIRVEVRPNE